MSKYASVDTAHSKVSRNITELRDRWQSYTVIPRRPSPAPRPSRVQSPYLHHKLRGLRFLGYNAVGSSSPLLLHTHSIWWARSVTPRHWYLNGRVWSCERALPSILLRKDREALGHEAGFLYWDGLLRAHIWTISCHQSCRSTVGIIARCLGALSFSISSNDDFEYVVW